MIDDNEFEEVEFLFDASVDVHAESSIESTVNSPVPKKPKKKSYRKKVESSWAHEEILKFISEVEARRCLWDAGCPEYKEHKSSIWQEVADAIPTTLNDCKGKWANLRTSFNCNLEKMRKRKSGQGTDEVCSITWEYFKSMLFLESKKISQSTKSTSSMQLESANTDESTLHDMGVGEEIASLPPSVSGQRRKKLISTTSSSSNSNLRQMAVEALQSLGSKNSEPKDSSTAFGEYIAAELRSLTPEQAAVAKSKLRRAFNDIMDEVSSMVDK